MSSKKPRSRPRPKISFAVDREEIGITSEWADTFIPGPRENSATGALGAPVEATHAGEESATVATPVSVAITATAVDNAAVEQQDTGAQSATVAVSFIGQKPRPKPVRSLADGLTPGQFIVYAQMYAKGEGEGTRLYRGGYQSLCAMTGLSKRGIQNVIGDLQAKHVVSIETPPGHNPSQVSVYRVRTEADILQDWYAAGLRFVLGKGKILVRQP